MRGDESASTLTTPPLLIKTMFLASVTPSGPHSPQHLLTTAIHTRTHTHTSTTASPNQHTTAIHTQRSSTVQNPTSEHVLTPYVVKGFLLGGGGLKEKPLEHLASQGGLRLSPDIHRETQRQGDRCSVCLSRSLGWWSWKIKREGGVKGCNMSQHLSDTCLKAALCSTLQTLRVSVLSMLTVVAGAWT